MCIDDGHVSMNGIRSRRVCPTYSSDSLQSYDGTDEQPTLQRRCSRRRIKFEDTWSRRTHRAHSSPSSSSSSSSSSSLNNSSSHQRRSRSPTTTRSKRSFVPRIQFELDEIVTIIVFLVTLPSFCYLFYNAIILLNGNYRGVSSNSSLFDININHIMDLATSSRRRLERQQDDDFVVQPQGAQVGLKNRNGGKFQRMYQSLFTIDEYLLRPHYDMPQKSSIYKKPLLIVGGASMMDYHHNNKNQDEAHHSYNAFQELLHDHLGVHMIMEDEDHLDVKAHKEFEKLWTKLVNNVLQLTNSANYNMQDFDHEQQQRLVQELKNLKPYYDHLSSHQRSSMLSTVWNGLVHLGTSAPNTAEDTSTTTTKTTALPIAKARQVESAIQTPMIGMALLPLFRQVFGNIRYIHVVQDGRDVALSSSSMSLELFDSFYGPELAQQKRKAAAETMAAVTASGSSSTSLTEHNLLAMDLWNDMNSQVLQYLKQNADGGETLDYIVVRAEDLKESSSTPQARLATIAKLADFVGSNITISDLCETSTNDELHLFQDATPMSLPYYSHHNHYSALLKGAASSSWQVPLVQQPERQRVHGLKGSLRGLGSGKPSTSSFSSSSASSKLAAAAAAAVHDDDNSINNDTLEGPYWRQKLQHEPTLLSQSLHSRGREVLRTFGYEPAASIEADILAASKIPCSFNFKQSS